MVAKAQMQAVQEERSATVVAAPVVHLMVQEASNPVLGIKVDGPTPTVQEVGLIQLDAAEPTVGDVVDMASQQAAMALQDCSCTQTDRSK